MLCQNLCVLVRGRMGREKSCRWTAAFSLEKKCLAHEKVNHCGNPGESSQNEVKLCLSELKRLDQSKAHRPCQGLAVNWSKARLKMSWTGAMLGWGWAKGCRKETLTSELPWRHCSRCRGKTSRGSRSAWGLDPLLGGTGYSWEKIRQLAYMFLVWTTTVKGHQQRQL